MYYDEQVINGILYRHTSGGRKPLGGYSPSKKATMEIEYDKKLQAYKNFGRFENENDVYFFFYHTIRKWRNGLPAPIDLIYRICYMQNGCDEELKRASQQGVQLTVFGADWRMHIANWLIRLAYRVAPFGDT